MKTAYVKGTDTRITGIKQLIPGCSAVGGFDDAGDPIFSGGTEVYYDDGKDAVGVDGGTIYMDDDGDEYRKDEIEFREEGAGE